MDKTAGVPVVGACCIDKLQSAAARQAGGNAARRVNRNDSGSTKFYALCRAATLSFKAVIAATTLRDAEANSLSLFCVTSSLVAWPARTVSMAFAAAR